MIAFLVVLQVLVSILLTVVILMQSSKGGGLAAGAFGGTGSMGAVFGGRGAGSFLSKATVVLASIFILTSVVMGLLQRGTIGQGKSLIQQEMAKQGTTASAADILPKIPGDQGVKMPAAGTKSGTAPGDTTK